MRAFLDEFLNTAIKTRSVIRRQFLRRNDDDRYLTLAPMGHTEMIEKRRFLAHRATRRN